jgi:hypothetical protein
MKIKFDRSGLGQSRWYEYLVRFIFGGSITALAGIVAKRFGPEIGGLFLAFPAILPATATLLEKHEEKKKGLVGQNGTRRGRAVAGVDAAGAAMGSIGLVAFALVIWKRLPQSGTGLVLAVATLAWIVTALSLCELREILLRRARARLRKMSNRRRRTRAHPTTARRKLDE